MKPILFLDIDGVIHPFTRIKDYKVDSSLAKKIAQERNDPSLENMNLYLMHMILYRFDLDAISYIGELIHEYDAKVIISSSWRLMYSDENFEMMFKLMKWDGAYLGKTKSNKPRYKLIKDYIKENRIKSYLVIDDLDMTSYFHSRMILCHTAFNKENLEMAKKSLSRQING